MTSKLLCRACDRSYVRVQQLERDIVLEASLFVYGRRQKIKTHDFPRLAAAVDARNAERDRNTRLHDAWRKAVGQAVGQ